MTKKNNNLYQLVETSMLDNSNKNINNIDINVINIVKKTMNINQTFITDIKVLKKGMTNHSYIFSYNNTKYILRIPGHGTEKLINRYNEAYVYNIIKNKNICEDIIYINPKNGYKITKYIDNPRVCDPRNISDLNACMNKLRTFHSLKLQVPHIFDIFYQIDFYEKLRNKTPSIYNDYKTTKKKVFSLKKYIDTQEKSFCLTHIDSIPDNFIFDNNNNIFLIDFEYSGMQDPHVDIAMFCIYSLYNQKEIDQLIDIYFENSCPLKTRIKIYCYISICGLLWSNWCEYKMLFGIDFGEYSSKQYTYAKEYYEIAKKGIQKCIL